MESEVLRFLYRPGNLLMNFVLVWKLLKPPLFGLMSSRVLVKM